MLVFDKYTMKLHFSINLAKNKFTFADEINWMSIKIIPENKHVSART